MSQHPDSAPIAIRGDSAVIMKQQAAAARAQIARQVADLNRAQSEAKALMETRRRELEAEFARQRSELDRQMAPLKAELAKMVEVAWTVDLYLGRDESLTMLRDGQPAPIDTPITVRQRVLVMAEESLVMMGAAKTGMTADDIPVFVEWLLADDANLDRVLPDAKGVVVLVPTKVESNSGNPWEDSYKNAANSESYWLLRNGERVYLLTVDPELKIGSTLLPRRSEFTEVFEQRLFGFGGGGSPVEPGSEEWMRMEKRAGAKRRHYMRIMLVLQGIVDRTPVWHPVSPAGVNFLDVRSQYDEKVRLVQDGDSSIQLTDGREPFAVWQRRLNQMLRPGLRVIGNWHSRRFAQLDEGDRKSYRNDHPRMFPRSISDRPASGVPHLIEDRKDGGFVIRFARTEQVWRKTQTPIDGRPGWVTVRDELVDVKQRASCVVMADDTWVLPFDLVTVPELEYYLNSRDNREQSFLSMVPTLHAALEAKRAEAAQEQPFREYLGRLLIAEGADESNIQSLVDELVHWWKLAKTWTKPLNGDQHHEGKAARDIVAEYRSRTKTRSSADQMIAAGRTVPGVICIASNRQGQWFAYAPSLPAHDPNVFLNVTRIRHGGRILETSEWQTIPQRSASLLNVAWSADEWSQWKFSANRRNYLSEPERQGLIEEALSRVEGIPICVTEMFDPARPAKRTLEVWTWTNGTPEDAEVKATVSPLDWRGSSPASGTVFPVLNDRGFRLGASRRSGSAFARFSATSRWGDLPWWPDDAPRWGDVRPRLVWSDEQMLDRVKAYTDRCAAAAREAAAERDAERSRVWALTEPLAEAIVAARDERLHDRFTEDYGHDAEDLWPAHLKSVAGRAPFHAVDLEPLVRAALLAGIPVGGQTLDELAEAVHGLGRRDDWGHAVPKFDTKGYGSVVVPAGRVEAD